MADKKFLKEYSNKIKALNPSGLTAKDDWDILEKRMNLLERRRRRRYVLLFVLIFLSMILTGKYVYDQYISTSTQVVSLNPVPENIHDTDHLQKSEVLRHLKIDENKIIQSRTQTSENEDGKYYGATNLGIKNKKESRLLIAQTNFKHTQLSDTKSSVVKDKSLTNQEDELFIISDKLKAMIHPSLESDHLQENAKATESVQNESELSGTRSKFALLTGLPYKEFKLNQKERTNRINFAEIEPIPAHKIRYFVKIDGGPISTIFQKNTGMIDNTLIFPSHEVTKNIGFHNGLSLQIAPNEKWKFGFGVNRSQLMQHASHIATLRLMDGICLNPNSSDPKEYAFKYNVTNGRSSSIINLKLSEENPGTPLDSLEVFKIEMGMHRKTVRWSIPITMERKVYSKNNWTLFAKSGVSLGFASNRIENITHYSESCPNLCFNHEFIPSVLPQESSQIMLGIILGTSLEWQLSPSISLVLNPEINFGTNLLPEKIDKNIIGSLNVGALYQIK